MKQKDKTKDLWQDIFQDRIGDVGKLELTGWN